MRLKHQRGNITLIVVPIVAFVLLVIVGALWWVVSRQEKPEPKIDGPTVSATDPLTTGNTNQNLSQDVQILDAGLKQDGSNVAATDKALNDEAETVVSDATGVSSGATQQKQQLAQLQTRASEEVNRRVGNLNDLLEQLDKLQHSSEAQVTAYKAAVNKEITTLTGINNKINGDTSLSAATTDAKQLDTEYVSYMLVAPKMHLIITADWQQTLEAKLETFANKIQDRLNTANNQGADISQAQITLNDLLSHVHAAEQLSQKVAGIVPPIQVGHYEANVGVLKSYHQQLNTANTNLTTAFQDAQKLLGEVQGL